MVPATVFVCVVVPFFSKAMVYLLQGQEKDGYEFSVCECLGEPLPVGRHCGLANPCGPWAETYHGLFDEAAVRAAIEQDRQSVSKAKATLQESTGKQASELTFKRFLSALAQDIDV